MTYTGGGGGYPNYGGYEDRSEMYPFFVPGEGIVRQVIQTDLPRYLGNNCYSKPGYRQGVEGYLYTAYRPLTDAQILSLKADSQKWLSERELMSRHYPGRDPPGYERSATFRDSLRTNQDGSNPDHPYPSFPPPNPAPATVNFPPYSTGPAPGYHHPGPYGSSAAPPAPGGPPAPSGTRGRYEFIPLPDGGKWYDHELKQYVPPYNPPENVSATVPRTTRDEPPAAPAEETDTPAYRRQMDPNPGPEQPGYYGSGSYFRG